MNTKPGISTTASTQAPLYVWIARPMCSCGSVDLQTYRSTAQGDGSTLRHCRCRQCGRPLRVVIE